MEIWIFCLCFAKKNLYLRNKTIFVENLLNLSPVNSGFLILAVSYYYLRILR